MLVCISLKAKKIKAYLEISLKTEKDYEIVQLSLLHPVMQDMGALELPVRKLL